MDRRRFPLGFSQRLKLNEDDWICISLTSTWFSKHSLKMAMIFIILEEDIVPTLSFRGGVAKATAVLLDFAHLPRAEILKKFKSAPICSCAMLEVRLYQHKVEIYKSSGIIYPGTILQSKLDRHSRNDVNFTVLQWFTLCKPALFLAVRRDAAVRPSNEDWTTETENIWAALNQADVVQSQQLVDRTPSS